MRVTEKGQVTIPKNIRENLGIGSGSEVQFILRGEEAILRLVERNLDDHERTVQQFADHLSRHKDSMSLGEMSGEDFYRLLRD